MVVVPAATKVTAPVEAFTVATFVAEDAYVSARPAGVVVAVGAVNDSPILAEAVAAENVTVGVALAIVTVT